MFIHYNGFMINTDHISKIETKDYLKYGSITIYRTTGGYPDHVHGAEATNIIMTLCPAVLEGKRAKYQRHAWAVHNLIGHPLMQIFSWLKLPALGIKIHDATVPEPKVEE